MALVPRARAYLFAVTPQTSSNDWTTAPASAVSVQFNPTTLQYALQNTLEKRSRDANAAQFVSQSSAKLELDLPFDSTHDGSDVRVSTRKLRDFLKPQANQNDAPPVVGFVWGTFRFKGVAESFRETLDFFSSEGVPLRSTIKLTLAAQNTRDIFTNEDISRRAEGMAAEVELTPVPDGGVSRSDAAANGFESMRNPGSSVAAVPSGQVQLKAAAGFAAGAGLGAGAGLSAAAGIGGSAGLGLSGSAGLGLSGSAGLGLSGSAGLGLSGGAGIGIGGGAGFDISGGAGTASGFGSGGGVGFSASAGAGFSGGASAGFGATAGASASAGVSSSLGAFNGLRSASSVTRQSSLLVATGASASLPATSGQFALGGAAISSTSSGLRADVGISARIRFS
jgi:hypothetical protein